MTYSIQHILKIVKGKLLNTTLFETQVERLLFDSRHLVFPTKTLFFAFKSNRQDGHQFIRELYQQGVRNFIITQKIELSKYPKANFILVKNSIDALQILATSHRQQFSFPIIGICS